MKNCKYCNKPLDDEANFCPYCMKRQSEPNPAPLPQIKKRFLNPWLITAICLFAAVVVIVCVWLLPKRASNADVLQTQASAYDLHAHFDNLLGMKLSEVSEFFGPEMASVTIDPFTETENHYFNGIEFDVMPQNETIYGYTIDYSLSDPPHRYNYRGIDSSTSYQEVVKILGLPDIDASYPHEVVYETPKGYLKVFFDANLKVTKLYAFFPLE